VNKLQEQPLGKFNLMHTQKVAANAHVK